MQLVIVCGCFNAHVLSICLSTLRNHPFGKFPKMVSAPIVGAMLRVTPTCFSIPHSVL